MALFKYLNNYAYFCTPLFLGKWQKYILYPGKGALTLKYFN